MMYVSAWLVYALIVLFWAALSVAVYSLWGWRRTLDLWRERQGRR